jgi:hypothetical protein
VVRGEAIDAYALDVLQNEKGLPGRGYSGIEQQGDVRVGQARQKRALAPESLLTGRIEQRQVDELEGNRSFESPVAAAGKPDHAHAAHTDRPLERVRPSRLTGKRGRRQARDRWRLEERRSQHLIVLRKQSLECCGRIRIFTPDGGEKPGLIRGIQVERAIKHGTESFP